MDGDADGNDVRRELKALIVQGLKLEGRDPESIDDDAPLFGAKVDGKGLELDSLDALELAMCIEERFGVRAPQGEAARPVFRSVRSLAAYVAANRGGSSGASPGANM